MKWPFELRDEAEREGYQFFDTAIRPLPKNEDGSINSSAAGFGDNDVDAFRHAYVSGVFTLEYGEYAARFFGALQEFFPLSGLAGTKMDLWNNDIGIKLALKHDTRTELLIAIREALNSGELIIDTEDERRYFGEEVTPPSGLYPVIKLAEDDKGRNSHFFDFDKKEGLTRENFVAAIKDGKYPKYHIRNVDGIEYPASNPDDKSGNNLS